MTVLEQDRPHTLRTVHAAPSLTRGPWGLGSVLALLGVDLVVLGVLVTAWYQASNQATPQDQIGWLDLAGVALLTGVGAHTGWLVAGRRAVGRRARALDSAVAVVLAPVADAAPEEVADEGYVVGPSMTRYHLRSCPLVADRATEELDVATATERGLLPCAQCLPPDRSTAAS